MAAINDHPAVGNASSTGVRGALRRLVPGSGRPAMSTDQLNRSQATVMAPPLVADPQLDGRSVTQWQHELGVPVHEPTRQAQAISAAELRAATSKIENEARNVSSDADLAAIGNEAMVLVDRINATPTSQLSGADRRAAALAILPLAEADQLDGLMVQATRLMKKGSREERQRGAAFMQQEGPHVRDRIATLDVPDAVHSRLVKTYDCAAAALEVYLQAMHDLDQIDKDVDAIFHAQQILAKQVYDKRQEQIHQGQLDEQHQSDRQQGGFAPQG